MNSFSNASSEQLLCLAGKISQNLPRDLASDIAQEWIDEPKALQKLLDGLLGGTCPLTQVRRRFVEVTIDPSRTVEQWIEVRKFEHNFDLDITPQNAGKFLTVRKIATAPYKAKLVAFNLGCPAGLSKVLRIRNRLGLKPIGFEHEAAFAEQRMKVIQRLGVVVNADFLIEWCVDNDGGKYHSFLHPGRVNRNPMNDAHEWYSDTWFLGLRE